MYARVDSTKDQTSATPWISASARGLNGSDIIFGPHDEIVLFRRLTGFHYYYFFSCSLLAKLDEMQHSPSPLRCGFLIAQPADRIYLSGA